MSWTTLEYKIIKVYNDHVYDARPRQGTTPQVGLGHCRCGEDMYWCDHSTHFARAVIAALELPNPRDRCPVCRGRAHAPKMLLDRTDCTDEFHAVTTT